MALLWSCFSHLFLISVGVLMIVMMVHVREVGIYKTILLNLVEIRVQWWMNVVVTVCLLILHSIKLTLVALVIFFELVIFVGLSVFDWEAILLSLTAYFLLFIKFVSFLGWNSSSLFVFFWCPVDVLWAILLFRFVFYLIISLRSLIGFDSSISIELRSYRVWVHDSSFMVFF